MSALWRLIVPAHVYVRVHAYARDIEQEIGLILCMQSMTTVSVLHMTDTSLCTFESLLSEVMPKRIRSIQIHSLYINSDVKSAHLDVKSDVLGAQCRGMLHRMPEDAGSGRHTTCNVPPRTTRKSSGRRTCFCRRAHTSGVVFASTCTRAES
jgi:hypothetical protein